MNITKIPLEARLRTGEVLECFTCFNGFNIDKFKTRLDILLDLYDSPEFKYYRDTVIKLTGADMSISIEKARAPFENLVKLGHSIDYLKDMRLCLDVLPKYNFYKKQRELELVVGGVYTKLELLAMHSDVIIDPAYNN